MDGLMQRPKTYAGATGRDLHIDAALTNLTIGYRPQNLIADLIYPKVPVGKQNDMYYTWRQSDWFRIANAERSRLSAAKRVNFSVSSDAFFCREYALAQEIAAEDLANADASLQLRESAANFCVDLLALAWEDRLATALTNTTNVGSNVNLTNAWSNPTASTPIDDIFTGVEAIRTGTGYDANLLIFSGLAWNNFRKHPDVIDFVRGKGDTRGGGPVAVNDVAAAFFPNGGGRVLLGRGIKNTADEDAPAVYTDIWSTACVILHVAQNPGLMVPTHGYTFQWTPPGLPGPMAVDRYSERRTKAEVVEVSHYQDEKVVAPGLGYLITNG